MTRPIMLCTGQWVDLPLETLAVKQGIRLRRIGAVLLGRSLRGAQAVAEPDYCERKRSLLERHGMAVFSISNHLVGQAVRTMSTPGTRPSCPPTSGATAGRRGRRARAAEDMKNAARAQKLGIEVVNGFTGSTSGTCSTVPAGAARHDRRRFSALTERWNPILDVGLAAGKVPSKCT